MKSILLLFLVLFAGKVFGQEYTKYDTAKKYRDMHAPVIAADDAYKFVGKMVIWVDSLYDYAILNDSTVACHMGEKINTPRLTLVVIDIYNKNQGYQFFHTFKRYRLHVYGTIKGTKDKPKLIIRGGYNIEIEDRSPRHGGHGTEH